MSGLHSGIDTDAFWREHNVRVVSWSARQRAHLQIRNRHRAPLRDPDVVERAGSGKPAASPRHRIRGAAALTTAHLQLLGPVPDKQRYNGNMRDFQAFCVWLFQWLVAKPIALFFRVLRQELLRGLRRRPNRK
ncbi:hypothetical protein [Actinospica robiniae]|uniref:hypothetical protein n=1 Tax=Actinospica robiniae TaxID=304901 RepID=UPI00042328DE|nr:hypothetical protein [Actinospica robiniae]